MNSNNKFIKFSSQADEEVLRQVKDIARSQGRKLQDVFHEAMLDYIEKKSQSKPRKHVMDAFSRSLLKYTSVYKKLAK